jgi:agmatine deiminase
MAALAELPVYGSKLVVEGGGFLSDGEGTLITAETCVLNRNRNPGWTKAQAEAELRAMLGVRKVIWLPGDVMDTETDGHVDGYVAYVKPATVLIEVVADPRDPRYPIMAENRKVLEMETDARGRRFELLPIAEAPRSAVPDGAEAYCRSYVNFYIANGAVIAPAYGIAEDLPVFEALRRAYPDRDDRAGRAERFVSWRGRYSLHHSAGARGIGQGLIKKRGLLQCAACHLRHFSSAVAGIEMTI